MNNLYNLGVIEVMDLSHMGKMSHNRARKIRREVYGGRPWRFPKHDEISYIASLKRDYNIAGFVPGYYWSSVSIYASNVMVYSIDKSLNVHAYNSRVDSASAYFILVRDL